MFAVINVSEHAQDCFHKSIPSKNPALKDSMKADKITKPIHENVLARPSKLIPILVKMKLLPPANYEGLDKGHLNAIAS